MNFLEKALECIFLPSCGICGELGNGYLCNKCGKELEKPMSLSRVEADEKGKLIHVDGILKKYEGQIIRQRLRKRYVLAEVELFQRKENVLFGIYLPGDEIWRESRIVVEKHKSINEEKEAKITCL